MRHTRVWVVAVSFGMLGLFAAPAAADGWVVTVQRRADERQNQRWSLAQHLAGKSASSRQDLWYRFFLTQRDPRPRLELVAGGIGQSVTDRLAARIGPMADAGARGLAGDSTRLLRTGLGYHLRLSFNHFVSGTTGIPTLKLVPHIHAEVMESSYDRDRGDFMADSSWAASSNEVGAGFRFLGSNQGDTAVYVDYLRRRQRVPGATYDTLTMENRLVSTSFESWLIRARGQLYLVSGLALTGSILVDESLVAGHAVDPSFKVFEHTLGGQLDLHMFRLSYDYRNAALVPRGSVAGASRPRVETLTHQVGLGFVF
jgi:hypothetical protein